MTQLEVILQKCRQLGEELDELCYGSRSMILASDSILAALRARAHDALHDSSRHLLCPHCRKRTMLYHLADGRRKCSTCGTKFQPHRKVDDLRLAHLANLLLCFALDFPAKQAAGITHYRYRLVSDTYAHLRRRLAELHLTADQRLSLTVLEPRRRDVHGSAVCKRCAKRFRCAGRSIGDAPLFGVKFVDSCVSVEPLADAAHAPSIPFAPDDRANAATFTEYAGFICHGQFHHFTDQPGAHHDADQFWSWMSEHLRRHHGIQKCNMGFYLKELEWKFNHRNEEPERLALTLVRLLPQDFLHAWSSTPRATKGRTSPGRNVRRTVHSRV